MREHPPYIQEVATEKSRLQKIHTILHKSGCVKPSARFNRGNIGEAYHGQSARRKILSSEQRDGGVFFMAISSLGKYRTLPPMYEIRER